MKNFKSKTIKLVLSGVGIFIFGIFTGYLLNNKTISSIQGYLFNAVGYATDTNATNSNATDTNATNSNATDCNATDANATDANATDANATNSNASLTDNIIYLNSFDFGTGTSVHQGDKIYLNIQTTGAYNSGASIVFKSSDNETFSVPVNSIGYNPYIIIPKNIKEAYYNVTDILLVGRNSNNTTFTKQYSKDIDNYLFENKGFMILKNVEDTIITLNSISLNSKSSQVVDKVYLNISASEDLETLKLIFKDNTNQTFTAYAKSLNNNPYFEIPTSVKSGTYTLTSVTLVSKDNMTTYTTTGENNTQKLNFNQTLEIIASTNTNSYIFNNEEITSQVITALYNLQEKQAITINADTNSIINNELFNAIKGTEKSLVINYHDHQIIFNGQDINEAKTIDVNTTINSIDANENLKNLISKGIVVDFADNGSLPGKALVRIKATKEISTILNDKVYAYFYNNQTNKFNLIDNNVTKTNDGYYEFSISHNSSYVLTNEALDAKLVTIDNDNVVSFQKSNKVNILLICLGLAVCIGAVVVIIIVRKKKMPTTKKEVPEEPKNDNTI